MNIVNVLLLVLLVGVIIFDSIMQNGLREKLRRADIEVMHHQAECRRLEGELQTALQRDEARRSHQCLIRDQQIKELKEKQKETVAYYEEQLRNKEAENQILEEMAKKIWDKVSGK